MFEIKKWKLISNFFIIFYKFYNIIIFIFLIFIVFLLFIIFNIFNFKKNYFKKKYYFLLLLLFLIFKEISQNYFNFIKIKKFNFEKEKIIKNKNIKLFFFS